MVKTEYRITPLVESGVTYGSETTAIKEASEMVERNGGGKRVWRLVAVVTADSKVERADAL